MPQGLSTDTKRQKRERWCPVLSQVSSIVMGITAVIMNYFVLLPMFEMFMPIEQIFASFGEVMPFIQTKLDVVLYNALPFNILKGLTISVFTMVGYKKLAPVLKGARLNENKEK